MKTRNINNKINVLPGKVASYSVVAPRWPHRRPAQLRPGPNCCSLASGSHRRTEKDNFFCCNFEQRFCLKTYHWSEVRMIEQVTIVVDCKAVAPDTKLKVVK